MKKKKAETKKRFRVQFHLDVMYEVCPYDECKLNTEAAAKKCLEATIKEVKAALEEVGEGRYFHVFRPVVDDVEAFECPVTKPGSSARSAHS